MFTKIFAKSPAGRSVRQDGRTDMSLEQQLAQAQKALQKLRNAAPGDSEAFPLLNESTRMVQQLEGLVAKLPHDDMRDVWRAQLDELQTELKSLTERVLNTYTGGAPCGSSQGAPPSGAPPKPPRIPSPTPPNRSRNPSPRSYTAPSPPPPTHAPPVEEVALFDDMDLFSGLSIAEGMDGIGTSAAPTHTQPPPPAPPSSRPQPSAAPTSHQPSHSIRPDDAHSQPLSSIKHHPPKIDTAPTQAASTHAASTHAASTHATSAPAQHEVIIPSSPSSAHPPSPTFSTTSTVSSAAPSATASSHTHAISPRAGSGIRAPLDENWFTSLADPEADLEPPTDEASKTAPVETPAPASAETSSLPSVLTLPVASSSDLLAEPTPGTESKRSSFTSEVENPPNTMETKTCVESLPPPAQPAAVARASLVTPPTKTPPVVKPIPANKKNKKKTQSVRVGYAKGSEDDDEVPVELGLLSRSGSIAAEAHSTTSLDEPLDFDTFAAALDSTSQPPGNLSALSLDKHTAGPADPTAQDTDISQNASLTETEPRLPQSSAMEASCCDEDSCATAGISHPQASIRGESAVFENTDGSVRENGRAEPDCITIDAQCAGSTAEKDPAVGVTSSRQHDQPASANQSNANIPTDQITPVHDDLPEAHMPLVDKPQLDRDAKAEASAADKSDEAHLQDPPSASANSEAASINLPTEIDKANEPTQASSSSSEKQLPEQEAVDSFFSKVSGNPSERAAAAQAQVSSWMATAVAAVKQKQETEQSLCKHRREASAELAKVSSSIIKLEEEQAVAVEAEDFERADLLNTDLEALLAQQQDLQQQVKQLDEETATISSQRIELVAWQAQLYSKLSDLLEALCEERRTEASQVLEEASKQQQEAETAKEVAEGRVEVMQSRVSAKHKVLEEEQATLTDKIAAATKPAVEERKLLEEEHSKLQTEVEELERQLAAKRTELEASSSKLNEVEAKVRTLASKFDKRAADIESERAEVAAEEEVLKTELEGLEKLQEEAATRQQEFDTRRSALLAEAEELLAAGHKARADATSIRDQISDEAGAKEEQARLRVASQEASDKLQELAKCMEEVKGQVSELAAQCTRLAGEKSAAEEKVAEAQRRLPEIEADKKAAAAKKDFKEAARLSAESKTVAAQADKWVSDAKQAGAELEKLEAEQATLNAQSEELDFMLAEAGKEAGIARWRCLDFNIRHNRKRLETAVENEQYDEADLLQADIDADVLEVESLVQHWNLTPEQRGMPDNTVGGTATNEAAPGETAAAESN